MGDDRMLELRGLRAFSLSAIRDVDGVSFDAQGVFVGGVPLLRSAHVGTEHSTSTVRQISELNDELTTRYRLPIDASSKLGALALIAEAFRRGDLAMAAIATVQMQFPNPPCLAKGAESADELERRAFELHRSHLLKSNWDPTKHPRAGMPPNPGWFAPATAAPEGPDVVPVMMDPRHKPWERPEFGGGGGEGGPPELPFPRGLPGFPLQANLYRHQKLQRKRRPDDPQQLNRNPRFHFQVACRQNSRHTYPVAKQLGFFKVQTTPILHCKVDTRGRLHLCVEALDMI
jgi:hypothetical protein